MRNHMIDPSLLPAIYNIDYLLGSHSEILLKSFIPQLSGCFGICSVIGRDLSTAREERAKREKQTERNHCCDVDREHCCAGQSGRGR